MSAASSGVVALTSAASSRNLVLGRLRGGLTLAGPLLVVYLATVIASAGSSAVVVESSYALVNLVIVVGIQIFVGTSGVLSFGHMAFVAVGAWTMGLLTTSPTLKATLLPELFPFLGTAQAPSLVALALAGIVGGALAAVVAPFLMRLHGLQAGIATFALLGVVTQVLTYWTKIGPTSGQSMVGIPDSLSLQGLLIVALTAIAVSWSYARTRSARLLRAAREDVTAAPASGISVTRHRVVAFSLSGVVCGVGGALWAETNTVVQASQLSVGFTFTVLAMLVLGGVGSTWGAVVGTLVYSLISGVLQALQSGVRIGGAVVSIGEGAQPVVLGAVLVLVLVFRPDGITRGRELFFHVPARLRH